MVRYYPPVTVVCLASYFKGNDFLRQCKEQGCRVVLVVKEKLRDEALAARRLDEFLTVPNDASRRRLRRGRLRVRPAQPRRPHRGPRGVRRDARGDDPRAPAHSRHGHHDGPAVPRQAGDARQGPRGRRPRARLRPRAQRRRAPRLHGDGARRPGCSSPASTCRPIGIQKMHDPDLVWRAIEALDARPVVNERSVVLPARAVRARRRVPRRLAGRRTARSSSPASTATGGRRWRWRTTAASS